MTRKRNHPIYTSRRRIMRLVFDSLPATVAQLVERLELKPTTAGRALNELFDLGLVEACGKNGRSKVWRRRRP